MFHVSLDFFSTLTNDLNKNSIPDFLGCDLVAWFFYNQKVGKCVHTHWLTAYFNCRETLDHSFQPERNMVCFQGYLLQGMCSIEFTVGNGK